VSLKQFGDLAMGQGHCTSIAPRREGFSCRAHPRENDH
jgi:hypothetical protein